MDAILENDPQRAAQVVKLIRGKVRASETPEFARALHDAPDRVRAKFLELTSPKSMKPSATAVAFFRKHSGRRSSAGVQSLARAEATAEALGWSVEWEHDPHVDKWWDNDDDAPAEVLSALLRDKDRNVLTSSGGIGMSGNLTSDRDYARVLEAELAEEALRDLGIA